MTAENRQPEKLLKIVRPWAVLTGVGLFIAAIICHVQGQALAGQVGNERLLESADQAHWLMVTLPLIIAAAGVTTLGLGFDKSLTLGAYPFAMGMVVGLVLLVSWFVAWTFQPRMTRNDMTLRSHTTSVRLHLPPEWIFVHAGRYPETGGTLLDDRERARLSINLNSTQTIKGPIEFWETPGGRLEVQKMEAESDYPFRGFRHAVAGKVRKVNWSVRIDQLSLIFSALLDEEEESQAVVRELVQRLQVNPGQ